MTRILERLLLLVVLVGSPGSVLAQLRPEVIQNGKQAVALVEVDGIPEKATAFAIDTEGRFVTTAGAILAPVGPPDEVELTIDLGGRLGRKKPMARVRRVDRSLGLAWLELDLRELQFTGGVGPDRSTLQLGSDAGLVNGTEVTILGFPTGTDKSDQISVHLARVATIEREENRVARFEIEAPFNRGLVGAPVLDKEGKVVGIIAAPQPRTSRIVAMPVGRLETFLSIPVIRYSGSFRGELDLAQCNKPQVVSFLVDRPRLRAQGPVDVEVAIESSPGDRRMYQSERRNSSSDLGLRGLQYAFGIVPVPATNRSLVLTVDYQAGAIQGQALDRELRAGERVLRLADLKRIYLKPVPRAQLDQQVRNRLAIQHLEPASFVLLKDQSVIPWPVTGLSPLSLEVDGTAISIDLDRAKMIDVRPGKEPPAPATIGCTVIARQGKQELSRRFFPLAFGRSAGGLPANRFSDLGARPTNLNRGLELEPVPAMPVGAHGAGASIKAPPIPADGTKEVPVDGIIGDVVTGGEGRYLLLVLRQSRRLAVFDVNAARIVGNITLPATDALVAAGAETALLFDPKSKRLETWDLKTRTRTAARPFLTNCRVKNIAMGSDSNGPLLVYWQAEAWSGEPRGVGLARKDQQQQIKDMGFFSLIDPATLCVARFVQPNRGPVVDGPPEVPEPGEARILPMASRIRFIPGLQRDWQWDQEVYGSHHIHVRASPDGRMFGIWGDQGVGRVVLVVDKDTLQCFDMGGLARPGRVVPGPAGATIFSAAGVFDTQGRRRHDGPSKIFLPSNDPTTFLAVGGFQDPEYQISEGYKQGRRSCDIYLDGNSRPVLTLANLDEMSAELDLANPLDLTLDKRFHYIPAARLLITIPGTNDWLVLRRIDPTARLPHAGSVAPSAPPK